MEKCFKLNPYYIFVANKMVNGKKCIPVWYVDDNKVFYMEAKVVEDSINNFKNHFVELVVTRGNKHKFWGVN